MCIFVFILSLSLLFIDNLDAKVIRVGPGENNVGVQFQAQKPGDTFTITVAAAEGYILVSASLDTKESSGLWTQQGFNFIFTASKAGTHNLVVRGKLKPKSKPGPGAPGPGALLDFTLRAIATYYVITVTPAEDATYAKGDLIGLIATVVTATGETVTGTVKWTLQGDEIGLFKDKEGNMTPTCSSKISPENGMATALIFTDATENAGVATVKAVATINIEGGTATAEATTGELTIFKVEIDTPAKFPVCIGGHTSLNLGCTATPSGGIYKWKKVSGPGNVTFSPNDTAEDPSFSVDTPGIYTVKIEYTKGGATASDTSGEIKVIGPWIIDNMTFGTPTSGTAFGSFPSLTLSESEIDIEQNKLEFFARALGATISGSQGWPIPVGGACWAGGTLGGIYKQDEKGKVIVSTKLRLKGKVGKVGVAATASLKIWVQIDNRPYKLVHSVDDTKVYEGIYSFLYHPGTVSAGAHTITVKFKGHVSAHGDGEAGVIAFSNYNDNGYFVKVEEIKITYIECEE